VSEHDNGERNPLEQALDLFFYAPIGFLLNADEVIPQLIERGRAQVKMARMFGQFAVTQGQTEANKVTDRVEKQAAGLIDQLAAAAGARRSPPAPRPSRAPAATAPAATPQAAPAAGPAVDSLAIPDYDSLSASQVVPRLAGLSGAELQAVGAYEVANRGRKTILSKVAQLQAS
jgi:hypothetical protein